MEAKHLTKDLDNLNAIKLDIALNYSVFLNEIMNKRINSYFAAKEAVFNALSDLKNCDETQLGDEQMRDSLICIEILNRNVEEKSNNFHPLKGYYNECVKITENDLRKMVVESIKRILNK